MRGMVFGVEADRLIVQASPADVRRFAKGGGVLVDPASADEHGLPFEPDGLPLDAGCMVVLKSACGGVQHKLLPDRFPPCEIRVPIRSPLIVDWVEMETVTIRTYRLAREYSRNEYEYGNRSVFPDPPGTGRWNRDHERMFQEASLLRLRWYLYEEELV